MSGYLSTMWCGKCSKGLGDCTCPDRDAKLRKLSGPDGPLASRWCARCDRHFVACTCLVPEWRLRVNGKLVPLPAKVSAD